MDYPEGDPHPLFGRDLLELSSDSVVARYNGALEGLGLEPTELPNFRIDGRGWSPEIAVERGDVHYLSHGPANPLGVVVSPDQAGRPLYAPIHSFEGPLMRDYHTRFRDEIAELTRTSAIALDLEQELGRYSDPTDLLLVQDVTVRSYAGPLSRAAAEQRALVERFDSGEWFDPALRRELLTSARDHGDLRFRALTVPAMPFATVRNLYADVFGGVFVLRAPESGNEYLILQSEGVYREGGLRDSMWLYDPELPEQLVAAGFVELTLSVDPNELARLRTLQEALTIDLLSDADPDAELEDLRGPQRKRRLRPLDGPDVERLYQLEALITRLEQGQIPDPELFSPGLTRLLLRPERRLDPAQRAVVAQLLLRLESGDVRALYRHDRAHFYQRYAAWGQAKRSWVEGILDT
jgi:hypothetical protein